MKTKNINFKITLPKFVEIRRKKSLNFKVFVRIWFNENGFKIGVKPLRILIGAVFSRIF